MLNLQRYYGERGGSQHGDEPLHWPGTVDGFPFRGNTPPDLKQREAEDIQHTADFRSRMFELWNPQDKSDFDDINNRVSIGWYVILKRIEKWDDEKQHLRVWLEWLQIYGQLPSK